MPEKMFHWAYKKMFPTNELIGNCIADFEQAVSRTGQGENGQQQQLNETCKISTVQTGIIKTLQTQYILT